MTAQVVKVKRKPQRRLVDRNDIGAWCFMCESAHRHDEPCRDRR